MAKIAALVVLALACAMVSAWPYGEQKIRGVNLGGWLLLEKWMTPHVFSGLPDWVNDEWQLCEYLGADAAVARLRQHWDSWVTEKDIMDLKDAGINHLRIPIGYWAIETRANEPYVKGSFDYVIRAVDWAKKHGLQVMVDLHGAPGSQNGNDHSGHSGSIDFYNSDANLQLATRVLGNIAAIFNAPQYRDTVSIIQLLNEPVLWDDYNYRLGRLKDFYRMAYDEVRKYNDIVVVAVHDAFIGLDNWYYLRDDPHYFWVMLDNHYYQVFTPEWNQLSCAEHHALPCHKLGELGNANNKLWTIVGEWSLATPNGCSGQDYFARQQIGVFETVSGWFMWSFKHGNGWNEWDFLASWRAGHINLNGAVNPQC